MDEPERFGKNVGIWLRNILESEQKSTLDQGRDIWSSAEVDQHKLRL